MSIMILDQYSNRRGQLIAVKTNFKEVWVEINGSRFVLSNGTQGQEIADAVGRWSTWLEKGCPRQVA
jgi:hypothetical protein